MLEIKRSFLPLSEIAQAPDYISLIRPSILPFLLHPSPAGQWIAIEAYLEKELVGLILSEVYDDHLRREAQLYSFIVKPLYRRQGIGRQLFAFTQNLLLQEEKIDVFEFYYTQEDSFTLALERILASQGWTPAKTFLIRCHFDALAFNPPWIHYPFHLPPSLSFFSWKNLLPTDKEYIAYLAYQRRFPPYLNPLREEALIDLETSVGLRQEGRVIGWCITQRPNPSTICYSILYIDQSFLYTGYGIQLLVESIRRQKQLLIPHAILEINIKEIDRSWWLFLKKRLIPLASKIDRIKHAIHIFAKYY